MGREGGDGSVPAGAMRKARVAEWKGATARWERALWRCEVSSEVAGADLAADMHRATQVDQLASRVAACLVSGEEILAGFRDIQLLQWESPAGRAYRDTVALQAVALRRCLESLAEARVAVERHSRETLVADCSYPGRL
jgi:hypothetical protein